MRVFFDTNILIYLFDDSASAKRERALELYRDAALHDAIVMSAQILNEFFTVALRNPVRTMSIEAAERAVRNFAKFPLVSLDAELTLKAIERVKKSQLNFWDALVIEAALRGGADVLYSEDMHHGMDFDGVRLVNPFV
jgi:predicted nucleic acid-binding protein